MDQLKAMRIFCRLVELSSYTAVAEEQGYTRSAISRIISQLEKTLQVSLLNRSTRNVQVTDLGREYYTESLSLLGRHEELDEKFRKDKALARGLLRIGAPGPLIQRKLLPKIADFTQRYPEIKISFQVSEGLSDLYKEELDLVIRMGEMKDSNLMGLALAPLDFACVASPDFLAKHTIIKPQDLAYVPCVCFRGRGRGSVWKFSHKGKVLKVPVSGPVSADCGFSIIELAKQNLGVTYLPRPLIEKELAAGVLVDVFSDYVPTPFDNEASIHLLYHKNRRQSKRIRAFIDWIKEPGRLLAD